MKNRMLEIGYRSYDLTFELEDWSYSISGTWQFKDYDEVSDFAFIEINVEISEKWDIETEDIYHQHLLTTQFLEDLRLELQEKINLDTGAYDFWDWKIKNDESAYDFYCEL
jgi:hypothetical protein